MMHISMHMRVFLFSFFKQSLSAEYNLKAFFKNMNTTLNLILDYQTNNCVLSSMKIDF